MTANNLPIAIAASRIGGGGGAGTTGGRGGDGGAGMAVIAWW